MRKLKTDNTSGCDSEIDDIDPNFIFIYKRFGKSQKVKSFCLHFNQI